MATPTQGPNLYAHDAVVVLGKELRRDAPRAIRELKARAAAAAIALRGGVPRVATLEAPLRGQSVAGSHLVARLLAELGVPPMQVHQDTRTRSTREEALESAALARRQGWRSLLVITARYHVPRAARYFHEVPGIAARVVSPDAFLADATPTEQDWIEAGRPDAEALAAEARSERLFGMLGSALAPLPRTLRWRVEVLAGAALRGVIGTS
jgi:hypothetical protein